MLNLVLYFICGLQGEYDSSCVHCKPAFVRIHKTCVQGQISSSSITVIRLITICTRFLKLDIRCVVQKYFYKEIYTATGYHITNIHSVLRRFRNSFLKAYAQHETNKVKENEDKKNLKKRKLNPGVVLYIQELVKCNFKQPYAFSYFLFHTPYVSTLVFDRLY